MRRAAAKLMTMGLLLPVGLSGQERRAAIGTVTGPDGQPLAAAEVVLAGAPFPAWCRTADVVRVVADAAGRFRADLLPSIAYSAWATGPVGGDGSHLAAPVSENAGVGRFLELRAQYRLARGRLQVQGLDAWQPLGALRVQVVPLAAARVPVPLALDGDGAADLPPLPSGSGSVQLLDAAGELLWEESIDFGGQRQLRLPRLQRLPARVFAADAPLAGAVVLQMIGMGGSRVPTAASLTGWRGGEVWRRIAATDAEGRAELLVPLDRDPMQRPPSRLLFAARAPGHTESVSGWYSGAIRDGAVIEKHDGELQFHLAALPVGEPGAAGRLRPLPGQPLAGTPLLLCGRQRLQVRKNSTTLLDRMFAGELQEDGSWSLPSMPAGFSGTLLVGPLPTPAGEPALAAAPVPWQPGAGAAADGAALQPFELQLVRPDGAPATGCPVLLMPVANGRLDLTGPGTQFLVDGSGAARLQLPPGNWFVYAGDDSTFQVAVIEVADRPVQQRLAMQPLLAVACRVLTRDGEPAAGATVRLSGSRVQAVSLEEPMRLLSALHTRITQQLIVGQQTDAAGLATLRLLPMPGRTWRVMATWRGRSSPEMAIDPDGGELTLQVK